MVVEIPGRQTQEIIDVDSNEFESGHEFRHFFLKEVWQTTESHRESLILVLAKWQDDCTVLLGIWVEFYVIVTHVQIEAGTIHETF